MEQYIWLLYDAVVVLIILLYMTSGARKGFVSTFIEMIGYVVALIGATYLSTPLASATYQRFVAPSLVEKVSDSINSSSGIQEALTALAGFMDKIPEYISKMFHLDGAISSEGLTGSVSEVAQTIVDKAVAPSMILLIRSIYFIIIFFIVVIIAKICSKFFRKLYRIPLVGPVNRVLGGVLGIGKGIIVLLIITTVIGFFIVFSAGGRWYMNESVIDDTLLFSKIYYLNPILNSLM